MPDKTWKACERTIARRFGGRRTSNSALGLRTPDVETGAFSVEIKTRSRFPAWLTKAIDQAVRNASAGKCPLVVLHQKGRRHDNDIVLCRLADFLDWFGDPQEEDVKPT